MKKHSLHVLLRAALLALALMLTVSAALAEGFHIAAPSGAPGLALATLAVEDPETALFLTADTIPAEFAKAESEFIIAPLNAGAKLFKAGKSDYRLAAVVTWGNLCFASQRADFKVEDIAEAGVTLFGEETINASVALYALSQNGVEPASVEYLAGAANTQSLLLSDPEAIVLTAEPALTAAKLKNEAVTGIPVNDLLAAAGMADGFAQAGLFIRGDLIADADAAAFIDRVKAACDACESNPEAVAEAAASLELMPNAKVALQALPRCGVRFVASGEAREQVEATANIDLKQFGGALPEDGFYYVP